MSEIVTITTESASFRLVGVITIGVTHIPIIGLGYPESLKLDPAVKKKILDIFQNHTSARIDIDHPLDSIDRVTWSIFKSKQAGTGFLFEAHTDVPVEIREEETGTRLFMKAAKAENGFLVAVTLEDKTHLCFYDMNHLRKDAESGRLWRLSGTLSRFVTGKAVPLLRTIERLISQISPQRRIEIPDEELGIIYQSVSGQIE